MEEFDLIVIVVIVDALKFAIKYICDTIVAVKVSKSSGK